MLDVIIVGGGAAGFYAAVHIAEADPRLKIAILERGKEVLAKVKVSGGGRCNVTHAEFDPSLLVKNYPRGEKELLGPFHTHCSGDTVAFFERKGIPLAIEDDGRMFPVSNTSQTLIDFFLRETQRLGITVVRHSPVTDFRPVGKDGDGWLIRTAKAEYRCKKVLIATGSNPKIWDILQKLGHRIEPPVPSLFTFCIADERIKDIPGLSTYARVNVPGNLSATEPILESEGPLLITHWGMSGPAILKLSAWGARILNDYGYRFQIRVNWLPQLHEGDVLSLLKELREAGPKKTVLRARADLPKRLWANLVRASGIPEDLKWSEVSKVQLQDLADQLTRGEFQVEGKSTFKEEFVTAGGVDLKEIHFKTFESKLHRHLFFAGEVINVDAITGGFNFQNAWTGAYIAAKAIAGN